MKAETLLWGAVFLLGGSLMLERASAEPETATFQAGPEGVTLAPAPSSAGAGAPSSAGAGAPASAGEAPAASAGAGGPVEQWAEEPPTTDGERVYVAVQTAQPPRIDGHLDDPMWELARWSGDFVQHQPEEGAAPYAQTAFKILYDRENLYVAFRVDDPEPEKISSLLARRDNFPGDWVEIEIDSYHDHQTAYSFTASVSGTQGDEFVSRDGDSWDANWNPVWQHKAVIGASGWTAEARIPLSQLRYNDAAEQVWGLQVLRRIHRLEERSSWQPVARGASGWVSEFGQLRGIRGIGAQKQVELLPYAVTRAERFERVTGDPFRDGSRSNITVGLDGKIGLSGNSTLDLTINPDFGQVEADPSEVNLTAFETFFEEKRPFFIEGRNVLRFPLAPSVAFGTHTSDQLFYSRRIGRAPQAAAWDPSGGFIDQPENTSILGAAKFSGRTPGGLSLAILESVTAEESARIESVGRRSRRAVEPATNYFAGRLQKDYREGRTQLGAMATTVHRRLGHGEPQLGFLHRAAYTGGLDALHYLKGRSWYVALRLVGSRVEGSREAILRTQTVPARYYQRPDRGGGGVDSTRTSLSGHGGSLLLGEGEGKVMWQTGVAVRSPGLELNDIGYLRNSDEVNQFTWAGYRTLKPVGILRSASFNLNQWLDYNYTSGANLYRAANHNGSVTFTNHMSCGWKVTREGERTSVSELRGGPSMLLPGSWSGGIELHSDSRRKISFGAGVDGSWSDDDAGRTRVGWISAGFRPSNALTFAAEQRYTHRRHDLQYVGTERGGVTPRYLYGAIDQETFSLVFRCDLALSPGFTIQYYGAPYLSSGRYRDFKRITDPRAPRYEDRFVHLGSAVRWNPAESGWEVDEDGDDVAEYELGNPDFSFRDFNSNLVVRWEYSPGSSLYLVWQQARSSAVSDGRFDLQEDWNDLFGLHPHNIVLIKASRWFDL